MGHTKAAPSDILAAYSDWGTVHGNPAAYARMALTLLSKFEAKPGSFNTTDESPTPLFKRPRSDSSSALPPSARPCTNSDTGGCPSSSSGKVIVIHGRTNSFSGSNTGGGQARSSGWQALQSVRGTFSGPGPRGGGYGGRRGGPARGSFRGGWRRERRGR